MQLCRCTNGPHVGASGAAGLPGRLDSGNHIVRMRLLKRILEMMCWISAGTVYSGERSHALSPY